MYKHPFNSVLPTKIPRQRLHLMNAEPNHHQFEHVQTKQKTYMLMANHVKPLNLLVTLQGTNIYITS